LGYLLLEAGFFVLLIPFMILWIVTIICHRKTKKNLASVKLMQAVLDKPVKVENP